MLAALAGGDGLVVQHLAHHVGEGDRQAVRLGIAQADGETGLGVTIHHQHFLPGLDQTSSQIDTAGRFGYAALLVYSPIVKTIKKLLEQSPSHRWNGQAKDLMEAGKYIAHTYLATDSQKLGYAIKSLEKPLFEFDGIVHTASKNGNAGNKHSFYYQDLSQFENLEGDQEEMPWQTT